MFFLIYIYQGSSHRPVELVERIFPISPSHLYTARYLTLFTRWNTPPMLHCKAVYIHTPTWTIFLIRGSKSIGDASHHFFSKSLLDGARPRSLSAGGYEPPCRPRYTVKRSIFTPTTTQIWYHCDRTIFVHVEKHIPIGSIPPN